ncbi:MAG: hypothetical protein ACXWQQ_00485 [Pseudobdellovibrio sp.]
MNKIFYFFIGLFFFAQLTFAASIVQIKGDKVLINLDGEQVSVGQKIGFKNADGKTVCVAEITQAKGTKAIATIQKGKLSGNETVFFSKGSGGSTATTAAPSTPPPADGAIASDAQAGESKGVYRLNNSKFAILLTIGMNTMSTKQADTSPVPNVETVPLVGNSFGLAASYDKTLTNWLIFHGTLGYEPFNAAGTAQFKSCDNASSKDCDAMINYLSAGGYARFNLTNSRFQMWAGLGGAAKFPISKTSTALKVDDIKMTITFGGAFGADWFISNKSFIPMSVEYQLFQSSDTVTANQILARIGYGWAF